MRRSQRRMREIALVRALTAPHHMRPQAQVVNGVRVQRGNLEMRSVCFENKAGEKAFGRVLARSADVFVSNTTRTIERSNRVMVEVCSQADRTNWGGSK
jgi:hypothetical protein